MFSDVSGEILILLSKTPLFFDESRMVHVSISIVDAFLSQRFLVKCLFIVDHPIRISELVITSHIWIW